MGMLMRTLHKDGRDACSDAFIQAIGAGTTWSLESFALWTFAARSGEELLLEQEQLNKQLDQRALLPPYLHLPL